jgi:hypothetical protein
LVEQVDAILLAEGWDVYHEVFTNTAGNRADVVAWKDDECMIVEVKNRLSVEVMGQAYAWAGVAHYIVAAFPSGARREATLNFALASASALKMGLWSLNPYRVLVPAWRWDVAHLHEHDRLRGNCHAKTSAAAQAGGGKGSHWTPFRDTVESIYAALKGRPMGLTTMELVASIRHHYATDRSARTSLPRWFHDGTIPGIEEVPGFTTTRWRIRDDFSLPV